MRGNTASSTAVGCAAPSNCYAITLAVFFAHASGMDRAKGEWVRVDVGSLTVERLKKSQLSFL